jgi:hypothetical protein
MNAQQQADGLVERVAFRVVEVHCHAVTRIRDVAVRLRNPDSFPGFWQPNWLTRSERRLHEGT